MSHRRARDVVVCLTLLCLVYVYVARHATLSATVSLPNPVFDEPLAVSKSQPTANDLPKVENLRKEFPDLYLR